MLLIWGPPTYLILSVSLHWHIDASSHDQRCHSQCHVLYKLLSLAEASWSFQIFSTGENMSKWQFVSSTVSPSFTLSFGRRISASKEKLRSFVLAIKIKISRLVGTSDGY